MIQIVFDNPDAVYFPSKEVSGNVIFFTPDPLRVRGIKVYITGKSEVRWSETRSIGRWHHRRCCTRRDTGCGCQRDSWSRGCDRSEQDYVYIEEHHTFSNSASESYLNLCFPVFNGGNGQLLPAGEHIYKFRFILPTSIPSSFEGLHGHVRYMARVEVDRPQAFDYETTAPFTVIYPLDLNGDQLLMRSVNRREDKMFCCLWCASGPLTVELILPTGGTVPGEIVFPTLEVENNSRVNLKNISMFLIKTVNYKANGSVKKVTNILLENNLGSMSAGESKTERVPMRIPPTPPSYLVNCGLIDVEYHMKAYINPSGLHNGLQVKVPLVIGTSPFTQQHAQFPLNPPEPGWNVTEAPSAPLLEEMDETTELIPTFEEVQRTNGSFFFRGMDNNLFSPKYPTYHQHQN